MPRYIDEQEIYRATDSGKQIFAYYFPNYDFGSAKAFVKERSEEKTASTHISFYKNCWRITDFGNQAVVNSLNGVRYVMHRENLQYYEALLFVEQIVIGHTVDGKGFIKPLWRAEYSFRDMGPDDKKGAYSFVYRESASKKELESIGPFITQEHLDRFSCKVVDYYDYCAYSKTHGRDVVHTFKATEDYPIFVFDYGDFKKVYKPHELDKKHRFSYVGTKPADYVYGWRQLQGEDSEFVDKDTGEESPSKENPSARVKDLFRCSGESDALNLYSLGYHVYWLNSETAGYGSNYKKIADFCENHYQILDLDATGQAMAAKNALTYINIYTLAIPAWLSAKKDFRGNPCKDIKDFINQFRTVEEATEAVRICKTKARRVKFWQRDPEKSTYSINMEYFYHFLQLSGFYTYKYSHLRNTEYCFVWIRDKIVDIIAPDQIKRVVKRFTKEWIKSKNLIDEISILNKLNTSIQITEATLETIDEIDINFTNYSFCEEYIHFNNCSLRITPEAITKIKHQDVPNYILGRLPVKGREISQIINHQLLTNTMPSPIEVIATKEHQELLDSRSRAKNDIELASINTRINSVSELDHYNVIINDKDFIFSRFLMDLSRLHWRKEIEDGTSLTDDEKKQESLALANLMFCIGYMAAQYKNPGKPWLVFLQDMKISEIGKSSGRSGKSLITKALSYVRNSFYIGGRELADQSKYQFIYDGFTEYHDILEVDDLDEHSNFSFFYTQVTGNRTINCKNMSPYVLEYHESGKMIISSNFELPNTDSSTLARILNAGVSDYYHEATKYNDYKETRSPLTKYGRQMYIDFTQEEWTQFYYFIAYCIQLQMRLDKINPPMKNLERRQYRREMSSGLGRGENFLHWANDYFCVWDGTTPRPDISVHTSIDDPLVYLDTFFLRKTALSHFIENAGLSDNKRKSFNAQNFKDKLISWCEYNGYELNPLNVCTDKTNRRILKKMLGKTEELFYIRTKPTNQPSDASNNTPLRSIDDIDIELLDNPF